MNHSKNLGATIFKAICLSTLLFWTLILSEKFNEEVIPFIFLSIFPIAIVCSLTIIITVFPFFFFEKNDLTNKVIFKKYFPFYSITTFGLSIYAILYSNVEYFICVFIITAFFTLMQSWIWISKP